LPPERQAGREGTKPSALARGGDGKEFGAAARVRRGGETGTIFLFIGFVTRVNSTNVLDERLRIGKIGRRINSKIKLVEIGVRRK
jgi:hypothetical protein